MHLQNLPKGHGGPCYVERGIRRPRSPGIRGASIREAFRALGRFGIFCSELISPSPIFGVNVRHDISRQLYKDKSL